MLFRRDLVEKRLIRLNRHSGGLPRLRNNWEWYKLVWTIADRSLRTGEGIWWEWDWWLASARILVYTTYVCIRNWWYINIQYEYRDKMLFIQELFLRKQKIFILQSSWPVVDWHKWLGNMSFLPDKSVIIQWLRQFFYHIWRISYRQAWGLPYLVKWQTVCKLKQLIPRL